MPRGIVKKLTLGVLEGGEAAGASTFNLLTSIVTHDSRSRTATATRAAAR
jgi:hypothetical protein